MTVEIDVKKLSKESVKSLLRELISADMLTAEFLKELQIESTNKDFNRLEKIINKHFEQYDEVFRKLA
ncbi:MAG TPA: hypothetical protein PKD85_19020 [Saprospiraceae bacterium]|nr:hypothetical protein [Saprospiraceae bacterium]